MNNKWYRTLLAVVLFSGVSCVSMAEHFTYPYESFKERDPFRPLINDLGEILIKEKKDMGDFILQGILYDPGGSRVIINNEVYKEGDVVEEYTIKTIERFKVIFEKEGVEFILKWEG